MEQRAREWVKRKLGEKEYDVKKEIHDDVRSREKR